MRPVRPAASAWPASGILRVFLWPRMSKGSRSDEVHVIPIPLALEVHPGDSLAEHMISALKRARRSLQRGDILVVKHKIVSKAEGRLVALEGIKPSARVRTWARRYRLDARVLELAHRESKRIVRQKRGILI